MTLIIEAVRTSESLVYFNENTRRYIAECSHNRRRESLKSHKQYYITENSGGSVFSVIL
jgi:hypothetical protein